MRWSTWLTVGLLVTSAACGSSKKTAVSESGQGDDPIERDAGGKKAADGGRDAGTKSGSKDAAATPAKDGGKKPFVEPPLEGIEPVAIDDCAGGALSASQVSALKKGGGVDKARFTYPYDGTVFPRGIQGPLLAWDGVSVTDAVYVHIKAKAFEYEGCLKPTGANELQLPDSVWETAGDKTYGKRDPFVVELTLSADGKVVGPITQKWVIAQATIKGSVYYNSYSNVGGSGLGGVVYRIPPRGKAEPFLSGECNGCHSLAANGSRITSQTLGLGARAYDIESGAPQLKSAPNNNAFSAMYPDGSHYLVGSQVIDIARTNVASPLGVATKATMFETDTGAKLPMNGIPVDTLMPSFSPDGSLLVFNDYALGQAHGLALMDYDASKHTATNYRELVNLPGANRPGWPFTLPDNGGVVFVSTDSLDFSAYGAGVGASATAIVAPSSDLMIVDAETGVSTILARAMGFDSPDAAKSGDTYLPFGAEELHKNYFPTVSPVAAGGYFWVFWDSIRHYGNRGSSRQLWAAAIEIQRKGGEFFDEAVGLYGNDTSHPAFYLPGQAFGTGNHRAFTALDPCKADGESCETGVDCCGGSCHREDNEPLGVCEVIACGNSDDRCEKDSDCCPGPNGEERFVCISNVCSVLLL
jgi:hypothetical protein